MFETHISFVERRFPTSHLRSRVTDPDDQLDEFRLSLDEAIRIALEKHGGRSRTDRSFRHRPAEGVSTTLPSRTRELMKRRARFNPSIQIQNGWNRFEPPSAVFDPGRSEPVLDYGVATLIPTTWTSICPKPWSPAGRLILAWMSTSQDFSRACFLSTRRPIHVPI